MKLIARNTTEVVVIIDAPTVLRQLMDASGWTLIPKAACNMVDAGPYREHHILDFGSLYIPQIPRSPTTKE